MNYQTIEVRKLTPVIGAEIFGVDLGKPLGNQQFQEVHDALMDNLVIFFRDQKMSIDQHKDFGRRFGPLHVHPNAPIEIADHPEILVIKADEKSKRVAKRLLHQRRGRGCEIVRAGFARLRQRQHHVGGLCQRALRKRRDRDQPDLEAA